MPKGIVLFRRVLRLHRRVLPAQMRALGDKYAVDEFKRHKDAPEEFLVPFFREWEKYCDDLEVSATSASLAAQGDGGNLSSTSGIGRPLSQGELEGLNDAQKEQVRIVSTITFAAHGTPLPRCRSSQSAVGSLLPPLRPRRLFGLTLLLHRLLSF